MATVICIGRTSQAARHALYLRSLGHQFSVVGSVHEYLEEIEDIGENVVLISENFDAATRQSVAHWVRASGRPTQVIYLYDHHLDSARGADVTARAVDLRSVEQAVRDCQRNLRSTAVSA
jgi:hypothetical protein